MARTMKNRTSIKRRRSVKKTRRRRYQMKGGLLAVPFSFVFQDMSPEMKEQILTTAMNR